MDISVTQFKHHCLEIIRLVERSGKPVVITRRGQAVARLQPPGPPPPAQGLAPWEHLRRLGGRLLAAPGESVLAEKGFEAQR